MKSFLLYSSVFLLCACNDTAFDKPSAKLPEKHTSSAIKPNTDNPYSPIDVSPVDISYLPADYPVKEMEKRTTALPLARIIYGRPHKQGRKIFGALLPYGEPWRMGANEATEIELFQPLTIQNKKIAKGRYILYCIPQQDKWTIVFNSNLYTWGLKQDANKDLFKFDVAVTHTDKAIEYFTMVFENTTANSANLLITWDDVLIRLPLSF